MNAVGSKICCSLSWTHNISFAARSVNELIIEVEDKSQAQKIYLQFMAYQILLTQVYEKSENPIKEIHYYYDRKSKRQFVWLEELKKHLKAKNTDIPYLVASVRAIEFFEIKNKQKCSISFDFTRFKEDLYLKVQRILTEVNMHSEDEKRDEIIINLFEEISVLVEKEQIKNKIDSGKTMEQRVNKI